MAKLTITFEDQLDGSVKSTTDPSIEFLMQKITSGHELTSAEGYLFFAANSLRKLSQKRGRTIIDKAPKKDD
jgi:hypothetical protein